MENVQSVCTNRGRIMCNTVFHITPLFCFVPNFRLFLQERDINFKIFIIVYIRRMCTTFLFNFHVSFCIMKASRAKTRNCIPLSLSGNISYCNLHIISVFNIHSRYISANKILILSLISSTDAYHKLSLTFLYIRCLTNRKQ